MYTSGAADACSRNRGGIRLQFNLAEVPDRAGGPGRMAAAGSDVARSIRVRQPLMTLRTFAFMGGFNPTPSSLRIGMSTGPNASKSACDSQMSKT